MKKANRVLKQLRSIDRQHNKFLDMRLRDVIEALKPYEVNAVELMGCDYDSYLWDDVEPKAEVDYVEDYNSCGNSYNWSSDIVFNWEEIRVDGAKYLVVKFHISGDVRGNYTDCMILDMTLDTLFEVVAEATTVRFSTSVRQYDVTFTTDALQEGSVFREIYITDKDGVEVNTVYDKYVCNIDTSERDKRKLAKQIRALFHKDGELADLVA